MFKEKCESVKKFVSDHKVELALGGLAAALGATVLYQQKINMTMFKFHDSELGLHEKEIKAIDQIVSMVGVLGQAAVMSKDDIEALAKHNGLTMEDVWDIALEAKEALTENN